MKKPLQVLQATIGKPVSVEMRGQVEVRGLLDGFDPHMNLVITKAKEFRQGKEASTFDTTILRGDSVIYIST